MHQDAADAAAAADPTASPLYPPETLAAPHGGWAREPAATMGTGGGGGLGRGVAVSNRVCGPTDKYTFLFDRYLFLSR